MVTVSSSTPSCKNLVLDAGPLLSLSPLRGLAETYLTVPQVLDELKDKRAREHFEQLGLSAGVKVEIRAPDGASLAKVVEAAKKTGDYSVLSHADLCVLALTFAISEAEKTNEEKEKLVATVEAISSNANSELHSSQPETIDMGLKSQVADDLAKKVEGLTVDEEQRASADDNTEADGDGHDHEPLGVELHQFTSEEPSNEMDKVATTAEPFSPQADDPSSAGSPADQLYDDPSDEDDGEGEWITPSNVALHKSRALDLLPSSVGSKKFEPAKQMGAACMTADFAMQNVLLQMGLNLVGVEGKRIDRVKTWVLRCHACFKICKDNTRKFCPSCGNPTLLRASVTVGAPSTPGEQPTMQVHLKKNFQYRLRGTKYSIPAPKPGSAKAGTGDGLILREDQSTYARAAKMEASRREREERKMMSGALERGARGEQGGVIVGSWMDPDWIPEIMSVGAGGKGRSTKGKGDMPTIGYGRKNPNERRRIK